MKTLINEKLIKRNKKIGNILSFAGLAILALGLILNLNPTPTRTLLSFAALIVGFIVAQIGTYFVNKFVRAPRADEIIANNLSKLNNDYTLYVYRSPVPMLLVGPSGLWIPNPIFAGGEIYYEGKWKQRGGSFFHKIFGQENIGRPEMDVEANEKQIEKFLKNHLNEDEMPPINSILVSLHPKGSIGDVEAAPITIVEADALRRAIRKFDRKTETEISPEVLEKINNLFGG